MSERMGRRGALGCHHSWHAAAPVGWTIMETGQWSVFRLARAGL